MGKNVRKLKKMSGNWKKCQEILKWARMSWKCQVIFKIFLGTRAVLTCKKFSRQRFVATNFLCIIKFLSQQLFFAQKFVAKTEKYRNCQEKVMEMSGNFFRVSVVTVLWALWRRAFFGRVRFTSGRRYSYFGHKLIMVYFTGVWRRWSE